ncbi:MAG: DUF1294 domain-containing protein [Anaerovibrio sp.]|nr:DUF1294 domain-containing protein [Anaerovibrio sp.]
MEFTWQNVFIVYLLMINLIALVVYGWDKICAMQDWWRVQEFSLFIVALLGGGIGALLAMKLFRHKTLHAKFKIGIPLILLLQIVGAIYLYYQLNINS